MILQVPFPEESRLSSSFVHRLIIVSFLQCVFVPTRKIRFLTENLFISTFKQNYPNRLLSTLKSQFFKPYKQLNNMKKAWGLYLLKCLFRSNTKWKYQCCYQPELPPRWNISPIDGVYCFCPTKYQCLPICYVIVGDFNFFRTVCKMRQKYYGQFMNFGHMLINELNRKRKK